MLIAPSRRGLFFPTGSVPRVNTRHPAAGALQAAYLFGPRPIALRPGFGGLEVKTGTPVPAVGRPGAYTSYTGVAGHQATGGPSGACSIVMVAMRGITAGSAGFSSNVQVITTTVNAAGAYNGVEFSMGNFYGANLNRLRSTTWTATVNSAADSIWLDGRKDATSTEEGATDLTNGVWYGVGTTFSNLTVGNAPLLFATFDNMNFGLTGGIQVAYIFRGVLPDNLMSDLTLNPAGLLTWPEDEIFYLAKPAGGTVWNETLSEALTAAESFAGTLTAPVTLAEALTGADAATVALTGAAALAEALTGADSHTATLAATAVLAESATAGEVLSPAMTAGVALSDAGTLADSLSPAATFGLSLSDSLTAADALTISAVMAAALAESVAGAESFAAVLLASTSLTDAATLADAYALAIPGTPAPASRTVTWRAHDRLATWAAETRTVTWRAHDRTAKWQE